MSHVDDLHAGQEWADQQADERAAAEKAQLADLMTAEPVKATGTRARTRAEVPADEISSLPNIRAGLPEIAELAASIRQRGQLSPVIVRPSGDPDVPYELIAGRRRLEALKLLARHSDEDVLVLADVLEGVDDAEAYELMLLENVQRVQLDPVNAARGLRALLERNDGMTAAQLARSLGLSVSWTTAHLKLLESDLPPEVLALVEAGDLSFTMADLLRRRAGAGDITPEQAAEVAQEVAAGELTPGQAREQVAPPKPSPASGGDGPDLDDWGPDDDPGATNAPPAQPPLDGPAPWEGGQDGEFSPGDPHGPAEEWLLARMLADWASGEDLDDLGAARGSELEHARSLAPAARLDAIRALAARLAAR